MIARTYFFPAPSPTQQPPSLGPSLMSPTPSVIHNGLGAQDRIAAQLAIEEVTALGVSMIEPLKVLIRNGTILQRRDALVALYRIDKQAASDIAVELSSREPVGIAYVALTIGAKCRDMRFSASVRKALKSDDELLRARAYEAAIFVIQEGALEILRSGYDDASAFVRDSVARAFSAFTYTNFNYEHSGFDSDKVAVMASIDDWIRINGKKTQYEWLKIAANDALYKGLTSTDPLLRYDAESFLRRYMGEIEYNWYDEEDARVKAAAALRVRWDGILPLFKDNPPLDLLLEFE